MIALTAQAMVQETTREAHGQELGILAWDEMEMSENGELKLNLGCGKDVRPGWVNIDRFQHPGVDYVLELGKDRLPFVDSCVDRIDAWNIFEHIFNWEDVMVECHRVLRPRGVINIRVPYRVANCSSYHLRFFDKFSMEHFCEDEKYNSLEGRKMFKYKRKPLVTYIIRNPWDIHIKWHFEHYLGWCPPIGRAYDLVFDLEAIK